MQVKMKLHGALVVLLLASISISTADEKDSTPAPAPAPSSTTTAAPSPKTSKCTNRKIPPDVPTGSDAPEQPELNDVFETTIEATFIKGDHDGFKPYTMEIKEFYDRDNNKAAVTTLKDGTETRLLYDVANSYAFTATKKKGKEQTCDEGSEIKEHPTKSDKPIPIYFDFSKTDNGGTISGLSDAFKFGGNYSADFLGYKKVRGQDSQLWSTCVHWDKYVMNFYVDWYFSKPDYCMPTGTDVVPVRLEVKGFSDDLDGGEPEEGKVKYHIQYDFVSYRNSISDPSVFWPELQTLCGNQTYYGKIPKTVKVEDTFSVNMEQIFSDGRVTNGKYVMDGTNNLMRTDIELKDDISNYKDKCTGTCKIIHDFNVGIEYVFQSTGACSIYNIEVKEDGRPSDAMIDTTHRDKDNKTTYIMLATAAQLFHIGEGYKLDYQGERMFRGVKTDAYVVFEIAKPNGPYREFHFTKETPPKLFGYIENGKKAQFQTNFYNFDATTVDMSAFDIDACFPEKMTDKLPDFKILHGRLELKETWDKVKKVGLVKVQPEVRKTLAKKAGVNTLRITNMLITPEDGKPDGTASTIVWFTLLGPSPVAGSAWHAVDVINPMKDTEKAEHDLENALEDDVALKIVTGKDKDEKDTTSTITLKGDSLKLVEDILDEDPRAPVPSGSSGHSNGQMALCGIISLVFGAFIGLGVGFYLWKRRNRGVPYQIHH